MSVGTPSHFKLSVLIEFRAADFRATETGGVPEVPVSFVILVFVFAFLLSAIASVVTAFRFIATLFDAVGIDTSEGGPGRFATSVAGMLRVDILVI